MTEEHDLLSDDEVEKIARLVKLLDRSTFDFLQLRTGRLQITIGKGSIPATLGTEAGLPEVVNESEAHTMISAADDIRSQHGREGEPKEALVEVKAPMVGRFYKRPEPKAAPFVSIGKEVTEESTVGLIEVMKVFTAVSAGVAGVIAEICAEDEQFVEYGAVLMKVRRKS